MYYWHNEGHNVECEVESGKYLRIVTTTPPRCKNRPSESTKKRFSDQSSECELPRRAPSRRERTRTLRCSDQNRILPAFTPVVTKRRQGYRKWVVILGKALYALCTDIQGNVECGKHLWCSRSKSYFTRLHCALCTRKDGKGTALALSHWRWWKIPMHRKYPRGYAYRYTYYDYFKSITCI